MASRPPALQGLVALARLSVEDVAGRASTGQWRPPWHEPTRQESPRWPPAPHAVLAALGAYPETRSPPPSSPDPSTTQLGSHTPSSGLTASAAASPLASRSSWAGQALPGLCFPQLGLLSEEQGSSRVWMVASRTEAVICHLHHGCGTGHEIATPVGLRGPLGHPSGAPGWPLHQKAPPQRLQEEKPKCLGPSRHRPPLQEGS